MAFGTALSAGAAQQTQTQPSSQQPPSSQQQAAKPADETVTSADVAEPELEQFARSINAVADINQRLQTKLESVTDDAQKQQMRQEANTEMAAAIKSNGLDVARYNAISRSLEKDAELNDRVMAKRRALLAAQQQPSDSTER